MPLEVKNINFSYDDKPIIVDKSFTINRGEITQFMGGNGSGKTTIINIITGFLKQKSGDILLEGSSIGNMEAYKRAKNIFRTFTDRVCFDNMSVLDNLKVVHQKTMWLGKDGKAKILKMLDGTCLEGKEDQMAQQLSGGEKRTLQFLMIPDSVQYIFLDEPFNNLSQENILITIDNIKKLKEKNIGVGIVDHYNYIQPDKIVNFP